MTFLKFKIVLNTQFLIEYKTEYKTEYKNPILNFS